MSTLQLLTDSRGVSLQLGKKGKAMPNGTRIFVLGEGLGLGTVTGARLTHPAHTWQEPKCEHTIKFDHGLTEVMTMFGYQSKQWAVRKGGIEQLQAEQEIRTHGYHAHTIDGEVTVEFRSAARREVEWIVPAGVVAATIEACGGPGVEHGGRGGEGGRGARVRGVFALVPGTALRVTAGAKYSRQVIGVTGSQGSWVLNVDGSPLLVAGGGGGGRWGSPGGDASLSGSTGPDMVASKLADYADGGGGGAWDYRRKMASSAPGAGGHSFNAGAEAFAELLPRDQRVCVVVRYAEGGSQLKEQ
jgi:hypothetical protein